MAQSSQHSDPRSPRHGYLWVWVADGLGLTVATALIAAAAGAPALKHLASWLIVALPFAGLAMTVAGKRRVPPRAPLYEDARMRTIVITPRPAETRN